MLASPNQIRVHRMLDDVAIVAADEPLAVCRGGLACEPLGEEAATGKDKSGSGSHVLAMGGSWPDGAWMSKEIDEREGSSYELYRRHQGSWAPVRKTSGGFYSSYPTIASCGAGCVIGLARFERDGLSNAAEASFHGPAPFARVDVLAGRVPWQLPRFDRYTSMARLVGPSGGRAFGGRRANRERRRRGRGSPNVGAAPARPSRDRACAGWLFGAQCDVARARRQEPDVGLVGGEVSCGRETKGYLATFDGTRWALLKPPGSGPIEGVSLPPAEGLFVVADHAVWKQSAERGWQKIELPPDGASECAARSVWARADDDVFVVADCVGEGKRKMSVLLRGDGKVLAR